MLLQSAPRFLLLRRQGRKQPQAPSPNITTTANASASTRSGIRVHVARRKVYRVLNKLLMPTNHIRLPIPTPSPTLRPQATAHPQHTNMTDPSCIFCQIVAGDAPAHKVYEDEHTLAFLDIHPLADFHTLLIPKHHVARMEDCKDASAAALGIAVKRVSRIIHELLDNTDFNILLANGQKAGQEVWHSHYHFIPREGRQDGLGYRWKTGRLPPQDAIDEFCSKSTAFYGMPSELK